jgi:hypothetical protein
VTILRYSVVSLSPSKKMLGRYLWSFENLATGNVVLKHVIGANKVTELGLCVILFGSVSSSWFV